MKVTLKNDWFAPTDSFEIGKRQMSGTVFKRGYHADMPDKLRKYLPKSATVHDEATPYVAPAPKPRLAETLRDHDDIRIADDDQQKRLNKKG